MIETDRLILRPIEARDHAALRAHLSDPDVMRFLLPVPDDAAFEAMISDAAVSQADNGFSFWAVERRTDGEMLGVCGLKFGRLGTPIAGMIEIGWRFGKVYWGQGYAREAARASLDWAWANLDVAEITSITVADNAASWGLMERLGMTRVAGGDFDHPLVPDGSSLRRHILYRIGRPA